MRKMFLLSLLLVSLTVSAQRIDKPNESYYAYCEMSLNLSFDPSITIGMEEETYILLDEEGQKLSFKRITNPITYMTKRGWELFKIMDGRQDWTFFFRKKVVSDKEVFENLKLAYKTGKNKGKPRE